MMNSVVSRLKTASLVNVSVKGDEVTITMSKKHAKGFAIDLVDLDPRKEDRISKEVRIALRRKLGLYTQEEV